MKNYKYTILLFFILSTISTYTYPQAAYLLAHSMDLSNFFRIPATYNIYEIEDSTEVFADAVIEGFFGVSSDELEEMLLYEEYDDEYNEGKYDKGEAKITVKDSILTFDIKGEVERYKIERIVKDMNLDGEHRFLAVLNGGNLLEISNVNRSLTLYEYYYDEKVDKSKFIRKLTLYEDFKFLQEKSMQDLWQFLKKERQRLNKQKKEIKDDLAPTFGV